MRSHHRNHEHHGWIRSRVNSHRQPLRQGCVYWQGSSMLQKRISTTLEPDRRSGSFGTTCRKGPLQLWPSYWWQSTTPKDTKERWMRMQHMDVNTPVWITTTLLLILPSLTLWFKEFKQCYFIYLKIPFYFSYHSIAIMLACFHFDLTLCLKMMDHTYSFFVVKF